MAGKIIQLSTALDMMDELDENGVPMSFQLKFVTADRQRKTGGEIIEVPSARKCVGSRNDEVVFDTREKKTTVKEKRDPHHWANATRNILLPNKQIRTIHIRLIIEFNHQKVVF